MFEPTRLSGEYLVEAYSQTVPTRPRSVRSATEEAQKCAAVQSPRTPRRQSR